MKVCEILRYAQDDIPDVLITILYQNQRHKATSVLSGSRHWPMFYVLCSMLYGFPICAPKNSTVRAAYSS